jgi:hypothetical protein
MLIGTSLEVLARHREERASSVRVILPGLLAIFVAGFFALVISYVNTLLPHDPERAAQWVGVFCASMIGLTSGAYIVMTRRRCDPAALGLILLTTLSVLLVSVYLYWVSFYVFFPADILLWSESDFVNDILKFRVDYPIYSPQQNNDSFVYTPAAQILTYIIAWSIGSATSIPVWRVIQLCYVLLAAIIATDCCRLLLRMARFERRSGDFTLWYGLWLPSLFLIATNSITNPYVYTLHNDALGLLISAGAYWLLLKYISTGDRHLLVLMAVIPAAGFLVKQSLALWAPLYCAYLLFFDRPLSLVRVSIFTSATLAVIGGTIGVGYLWWGHHFIYWVFVAMGKDPLSLLRSFQHLLESWPYFAIGMLGGFILLRGRMAKQLVGAWLAWLLLILVEAATSGLGWMLNHLGPGSLIAGVWFFAALAKVWPSAQGGASRNFRSNANMWLRLSITVGTIGLLFNGLGFGRIPVKHFPDDTYRYIHDIESEFKGQSADQVLLDSGSWIYLRQGVVMKDRGIPFGNRGYNGSGDFSGMMQRLKEKRYAKILMRNLNSPIFLYDHALWPKSSGIKQTLLENYQVKGHIMPVKGKKHEQVPFLFFDEITILVPKPDSKP